ncbi:MAG: 1-acyl-sn-glycerol-3-phosphate acyltransferase [Bacteroidota bacterium]
MPSSLSHIDVRAAIGELFSYPAFVSGMQSFLPEHLFATIMDRKNSVKNSYDFQKQLVYPMLKWIENKSINKLTVSGLEGLDPNKRYLFISNHRDIVLDSAFLNMVLYEHDFPTSQIAIGDNLMRHRISELLFLINKSFVVKREGSPRALYAHSNKLSEYIHECITTEKDSVWIAQREGRAKDGNDLTQIAVLKMLSLCGRKQLKQHLLHLNIVPVSIAYEKDPCDLLKTKEYLKKQQDPSYRKTFQEDVQYMLLGLQGEKGRLHFHFGTPLDSELDELDNFDNSNKQLEALANIVDHAIHRGYKMQSINYLAADLLQGNEAHAAYYDAATSEKIQDYFAQQLSEFPAEVRHLAKAYLLGIYANPVFNQAKAG